MTAKPSPSELAGPYLRCAQVVADHQGQHDPTWTQRSADEHVDAALRHMLAWAAGEPVDPTSGRSHLEHAATRTLMAVHQENEG